MVLMIVSAIIAVVCCLAAGRRVPWQGRQSMIVMAIAMVGLAVAAGDPGVSLLAGATLLLSAMLGTLGLRGATAVRACCHRAFGSLVMALCAFASVVHGLDAADTARSAGSASGSASVSTSVSMSAHGVHLGMDVVGVGATLGVVLLVVWGIVDRFRPHSPVPSSRLLSAEAWAMTAGTVMMWAMH